MKNYLAVFIPAISTMCNDSDSKELRMLMGLALSVCRLTARFLSSVL